MSEDPSQLSDSADKDPVKNSLEETYQVNGAPHPAYEYPQQFKQEVKPQRFILLPVLLFLSTCLTTFWVGISQWRFLSVGAGGVAYVPGLGTSHLDYHRAFFDPQNWTNGLIYMVCILTILFSHEMGHFLVSLWHRIPASLPYFIPIPFSPIGTMGAVIGMDGLKADRKQLFDIGIAGPLAGLVFAIPITIYGVLQMDMTQNNLGDYGLDMPLGMALLMSYLEVPGYEFGMMVAQQQLNPWFMAGWVGLFVTGLNMLPISQLDGGHISYTLFGRWSHYIARLFMLGAILFVVFGGANIWIMMIVLIMMLGTDHPPTRDDTVEIQPWRTVLGYTSLIIPVLCFPPYGIVLFE